MQNDDCLFCKISRGEIPSKKIYEDEEVFAFHDINPKRHITSLAEVSPEDGQLLGKMLVLAKKLALEQGCGNGFRIVINTGRDGGQEVPHLHIHVLGGPQPWKRRS